MYQSHLIAQAVRLTLAVGRVGVLFVPPIRAHDEQAEGRGHGRHTGQGPVQPWAAPSISPPGGA